jgi:two-component system CheB/CheR fusion protein
VTETQESTALEELLDYIKRERGFDFTGYKRPSLTRRISRRMQEVGVEGFENYLAFLEAQPDEFAQLFNTILINVTRFFRDAETWEYLREEIIPHMLEAKATSAVIRVWCTGCASGQEPYTMAMLLAETLGDDELRARVKIYATDVDEEALQFARHGSYSAEELESVPPELRQKYFEPEKEGDAMSVRPDLRRMIIFGRHDLIQDPPISRIDLLTARNTLIYFGSGAQESILRNFHFSLNDTGYLVLGRSEVVTRRSKLFEPVDLKRRVFAPLPRMGDFRNRLLHLVRDAEDGDPADHVHPTERLRETGFEHSPVPHLIVQADGRLAFANAQARHLFSIGQRDLLRPFSELEVSYRPIELRSLIDRAHSERRPVSANEIPLQVSGEQRFYDVQVFPMDGVDGDGGASIAFTDITRYKHMHERAETAQTQLSAAYEQAQSSAEELETTNEELQSTNEELETTNEELQSTNEELETMNEELQSTNQELETINDELVLRTSEYDQANALLESVLNQLKVAVVLVNPELIVEAWSERAEDLWGLSAERAVGTAFPNLEIGLPVSELESAISACLSGTEWQETTVDAVNRLGQKMRCRVVCAPLTSQQQSTGAMLIVEELRT